ncbi:hypothetical protein B0I35DRAFT_361428 [Stachybotrys elegans]|uniref:Fe2OG dioxygenase domain-containing protein n=1 Tax=Stachybotrys elegans TaxID=80388 RepID=A0A8K0SL53_9HYPO|nr:hypothetical protein B0I35DRAFT_361428 [Stachybotrys elegans]
MNAQSTSALPIIDLDVFRSASPQEVKSAADELLAALKTIGFVYIKNHGIPQPLVDEAFSWSARFFSLPLSEKMKAPHPPEGWHHRGYSSPGREKVTHQVFDQDSLASLRQKAPDAKESFDIGREDDARMRNVWPPEDVMPGFRGFFAKFYRRCFELEDDILSAIATCLDLDSGYFHRFHAGRENQLRLLCYPEVDAGRLQRGEVERIGAHTDYGTMTFLFQDDVGGLEVEDPNNKGIFKPVPSIPGTVVLNIGDFLQRWSNDILKSTMHRVGVPPELAGARRDTAGAAGVLRPRYSIPYFVGTDGHVTVDCIPGCYGPDRPKRYEPVNAREYIDLRANAAY